MPSPALGRSYVARVNRAIDRVVADLRRPLRLNDLAAAADLSPFHFHRVFQALVGETPSDFARRLRLEKALRLMAAPRPASLTSVAAACGFASSSDFSRAFKRRFGVAPRAFDVAAWRATRGAELDATVPDDAAAVRLRRLPPRDNPDAFSVRLRDLPARTVAYVRVTDPYAGTAVFDAAKRLEAWAARRGLADGDWLGYQWENPEVTPLRDCLYHVAVTAEDFTPSGEVGRFVFPPLRVAEVELRGGVDLALRALRWLYGSWLPRSGYVPDDHPGFEAFFGRPFAHGTEHFEYLAQLPIRRAR